MTWDQIALEYGTDKASTGHGYMRRYEALLEGRPVTRVLEIGVEHGGSLRTWAAIWPHAQVTGVDIDPACKQHADRRIRVVIADAQGRTVRRHLKTSYDLIVDDGDHHLDQIATTLKVLVSLLAPQGLYVVEDTLLGKHDWPAYTPDVIAAIHDAGLRVRAVCASDQNLQTASADHGTFALVAAERTGREIWIDVPGSEVVVLEALAAQLAHEHPILRMAIYPQRGAGPAVLHRTLAGTGYIPRVIEEGGEREEWVWYHPDGPRP